MPLDWNSAPDPGAPSQPNAPKTGLDWSTVDAQAAAAKRGRGGIHTSMDPAGVERGLKRVQAALQWAGSSPVAHAADAVMNADTRGSMAAIAGKNPITQGVMDPAHATDMTHAAERALGLPVAPDKNPSLLESVGQGLEDFGVETFGSPSFWLSGGTLLPLKIAHRAAELSKYGLATGVTIEGAKAATKVAAKIPGVASAAKKVADTPIARAAASTLDKAKSFAVEGHDLRKDVTRAGEDLVKKHEGATRNAGRHYEEQAAQTIDEHRDVLDIYDREYRALQDERNLWEPAAKRGAQTAIDKLEEIKGRFQDLRKIFPPEVRQALLQRAYREGSPEVRRKALAAGYQLQQGDREAPVLNILHHFNDAYEPTQHVPTEAEKAAEEAARQMGGVHYIRQNKKAKFDLPKAGGTPDTPLADRILDRLVTGSRIEQQRKRNLAILHDLGLQHPDQRERTLQRLNHNRMIAADVTAPEAERRTAAKAAAAYERLLERQNAAVRDAEAKRERFLQPAAAANTVPQQVEALAPLEAKQRYLNDRRAAGAPPLKIITVGPKGGRKRILAPLRPRDTIKDTKQLRGKIMGLLSAVGHMEQVARGSRQSVEQTGKRLGQAVGSIHSERHEAGEAARKGFGVPKSTVLDPEGKVVGEAQPRPVVYASDGTPITPPTTRHTFGDPKIVEPPSLLHVPPKESKRGLKAALRGHPALKPLPLLDASGKPIGKSKVEPVVLPTGEPPRAPTPEERKLAAVTKPLEGVTRRAIGAAQGGRRVTLPVEGHVAKTETRKQKAILSYERHLRRMAERKQHNRNVQTMEQHGQEIAKSINMVPVPKNLHGRLFGEIPQYAKTLAREFSDLQRDALFVVPFAHMKNIAILQALGKGGIGAIKRGMQYAHQLRVDPESLADDVKELEQMGASEHYIREKSPAYEGFGGGMFGAGSKLADFADKGNAALDRWDTGMRLALRDTLKKKGMTEPAEIGGQIRDTLGDYHNQAPLIRILRDTMGASFPNWGLGVVPRAMTKAIREKPTAFAAYARGQRLTNDDVTEPQWGVDFDPAGPVDEYFSMLTKPSFYASPARIGAASIPATLAGALAFGELDQYAARQALGIVPGGAFIEAATNWPYASNVPAPLRIGAGVAGSYFDNAMTVKRRTAQLARMGLKGPEITSILEDEGLIPRPREFQRPASGLDWSTVK